MKLIGVMAFAIFVSLPLYAQTSTPDNSGCTLTVAQSPSVRGIKLGMTGDELNALFQTQIVADWARSAGANSYPNFGQADLGINPGTDYARERLAGIQSFNYTLLDNHLVSFALVYAGLPVGPHWANADDFVAKLSEGFRLPNNQAWSNYGSGRSLQCHGFQIRATVSDGAGSFWVLDPDYPSKKKERELAFQKAREREFLTQTTVAPPKVAAPPKVTACTLDMARSPAIRGVKLGMTAEDFFAIFPEGHPPEWVKARLAEAKAYPDLGVLRADNLNLSTINTKDRSPIGTLFATFFDDHLVDLRLYYAAFPAGPRWLNLDDFFKKFAGAYQLPASGSWVNKQTDVKELECKGFQMRVSLLGGTGTFVMEDPTYQAVQKERRVAFEEEQRREFKP